MSLPTREVSCEQHHPPATAHMPEISAATPMPTAVMVIFLNDADVALSFSSSAANVGMTSAPTTSTSSSTVVTAHSAQYGFMKRTTSRMLLPSPREVVYAHISVLSQSRTIEPYGVAKSEAGKTTRKCHASVCGTPARRRPCP